MELKTKTNFSVDRENLVVNMSRVFDAPREQVYKICTDPSLVGEWWGPSSLTTDVETYDVRPGGRWRFIQCDEEGAEYAFHGVFREVVPPERLVYTFIYEGSPEHEIVEEITFEDLGGKTLMRTKDIFASFEALDGMVASGMESGAVESMERLARLVEGKHTGTVTSQDGTRIAYERVGAGPALIMVDGALGYRGMMPGEDPYVALLAEHFSVFSYDRRGRGASGDQIRATGAPYQEAREREVQDLEALIDAAGGRALVYGVSSGGALVLRAAAKLAEKIDKIAIYEVPYNDDPAFRETWQGYTHAVDRLIAAGQGGDAVGEFMKLVGVPAEDLAGMRSAPFWAALEPVAPTLLYDHTMLGETAAVPVELAARIKTPALLMDGGASFPFMHATAVKLAQAMPNARQRTLAGQTHEVAPDAVVPELIKFFKA